MDQNNTFYFSKSKYCGLWQCPKIAWLRLHKPAKFVPDEQALARMREGSEVGEVARGLFGDYVDVTTVTYGRPNLTFMIERTKEET